MSSCASTPTRTPARPASGSEVAPPPHPTSSTRPPSGRRSSARSVVGVGSAGSASCAPRVRKSAAGNPYGDSGAAARIAGGIAQLSSSSRHRSTGFMVPAGPRPCAHRGAAEAGASRTAPRRTGSGSGPAGAWSHEPGSSHLFDQRGALGGGEDLVHRADRGGGDRSRLERRDPLVRAPRRERLGEQRDQLLAMSHAILVRREPRVGGPIRMPDHLARAEEQPVVRRGDDERAIGGVERLVRADVRVRRAHRPRDHAAEQMVGRLVHHRGRAGIEQRHADVSPATGPLALVQRREDADRHLEPGDDVEESDARLHRFPAGLAGHAHQAGQRLDDDVVAGAARRLGHLLAEGGQGAGDQTRSGAAEVIEGEAEVGHQSRPEVLDQRRPSRPPGGGSPRCLPGTSGPPSRTACSC